MVSVWYGNIVLIILVIVWILPWKGYALWLAAERKEKWWFIVLLIVNTLSILEIYYIFWVVKKKPKEVRDLVRNALKKDQHHEAHTENTHH